MPGATDREFRQCKHGRHQLFMGIRLRNNVYPGKPSHTYTTSGNFTVTLTTTGLNGCSHTVTQTDYIQIQPPTASINLLPAGGCAPFSWTFDATINSSEPVATYLWDFGDGTTSGLASPTHIFNPGVYDISLIITTINGCRDTVTVPRGIRSGIRANSGLYSHSIDHLQLTSRWHSPTHRQVTLPVGSGTSETGPLPFNKTRSTFIQIPVYLPSCSSS